MAQKVVTNQRLFTPTGQVLKTARMGLPGPGTPEGDLIDCTTALAARDFCMAIWTVKEHAGDWVQAKHCDRIIESAQKAIGAPTWALDEADWEWLTKKLEEPIGAKIYGSNTVRVRAALDAIEAQASGKVVGKVKGG